MDWNAIYNKVNKDFLLIEVNAHQLPFLIDFALMSKIKKLQTFREKKSFGSFNLVMLSWRGRPATTGWSHNKRLNTYAYKRIVRQLMPEKKKQKLHQLLRQLFLNHWVMTNRPKLLMQIQLQTVLKLHVLILLALKTLYPNLSLKLHKCPYQNLLKPNGIGLILILN